MKKMGKARELLFRKNDKKVLVDTVKIVRSKNMKGTKGSWENFLSVMNRNSKVPVRDPSSYESKVLASFLATMESKNETQLVDFIHQWTMRNYEIEQLEIANPLPLTPEEELVRISQSHASFKQNYFFESCNEGWSYVRRGMSKDLTKPESLIALDCEMVTCNDGTQEVVRVCAVDRNLTTLIDTLVRPSKGVLDFKSDITGVTAEDLVAVSVTQTDVQDQVRGVLTPGTIVVGHSVHHDLKALKIHHRRVIDTQLIFPIAGRSPHAILGLRDLCKAVLEYDFREENKPHNCLEDARVPMKLVLHRLQHGPCNIMVPNHVDETELSSLLLHKVPAKVTIDDLQSLFPKSFHCKFQDLNSDQTGYSKYKAMFKSKADANLAFARLHGLIGTDNTGRSQKLVFFRPKMQSRNAGKVKLFVRKMGFDTEVSNNLKYARVDCAYVSPVGIGKGTVVHEESLPVEKMTVTKETMTCRSTQDYGIGAVQGELSPPNDEDENSNEKEPTEILQEAGTPSSVQKQEIMKKSKKCKRLQGNNVGTVQKQKMMKKSKKCKILQGNNGGTVLSEAFLIENSLGLANDLEKQKKETKTKKQKRLQCNNVGPVDSCILNDKIQNGKEGHKEALEEFEVPQRIKKIKRSVLNGEFETNMATSKKSRKGPKGKFQDL